MKANQDQLKSSTSVLKEVESITIKKENESSCSETEHFDDEPSLFDNDDNFDSRAAEPKIEIKEGQAKEIKIPPKKQYRCDICGSDFRTYSYVKRHIHQKHLRLYKVGCKICGKRMYDTTSLRRHVDSVHKKIKQPPRRTQCPHCGITIANLSSHLKYKHPLFRGVTTTNDVNDGVKKEGLDPTKKMFPPNEIYICDICSNTFVRKLYLRKHLLQKHLNIFEDKCPECNKGFYDKTAVKRHIKEHHLSDRPPPKRSICIKCGKYVTAIQLHMRRVHNSNKPEAKPKRILPKVECPLCLKMISSRQDNINEHNRRVHGANIPKKVKQKKAVTKVNK